MSAQPNQLHFVRSHRFSFMSPSGARYRHRPSAPLPVPSEARVDLATEINRATELPSARASVSRLRALDALARGEECSFAALAHGIIPDVAQRFVDRYGERVYGGRFVGEDGKRFVTSCQDPSIRVYETNGCEKRAAWKLTHEIKGLGVHWTITDFDISPDGRWLAYVSLNRLVHVVDLENVRKAQTVFDLSVGAGFSVNIWSIKWSHDGSEIVAGTGGNGRSCYGNVIIFDVQLGKIVQVLSAHTDDVNSVCFMRTGEHNLILSASDDALVKLWDRRDTSTRDQSSHHRAAGVFVGHQCGLTFVSTKDDGRFLLSNGKDQYIKLWDARKCTSSSELGQVSWPPRDLSFDYRRQCPRLETGRRGFHDDAVMSYAGAHETLQTLIRAYFSPARTTGQKYVYCGSSDGRCVVYEAVSGRCVRSLRGHAQVVRDVSWHPNACLLTTTSWDGQVVLWGAGGKGMEGWGAEGRVEEEEAEEEEKEEEREVVVVF